MSIKECPLKPNEISNLRVGEKPTLLVVMIIIITINFCTVVIDAAIVINVKNGHKSYFLV